MAIEIPRISSLELLLTQESNLVLIFRGIQTLRPSGPPTALSSHLAATTQHISGLVAFSQAFWDHPRIRGEHVTVPTGTEL